MRELPDILAKINRAAEAYESKQLGLIHDQAEILRDLSVALHFLVEHKVEAHQRWLGAYYECKERAAVHKEKYAHNKVPELYMIRHFLNSGQELLKSIRSTLSANKQ